MKKGGIRLPLPHQPYSQKEHWNAFWRMFYRIKRAGKLIEIPITEDMLAEAKAFTEKVILEKQKEEVHQRDGRQEKKRWMTGTLGELALERFLGVRFRDPTVGDSIRYAVPDLSTIGLPVGVKSFRAGNFPLVNRLLSRNPRKPLTEAEIFIAVEPTRMKAYLFGLAFQEDLIRNEQNPENDRYVKDGNALDRKTAFTSFDTLHSFHCLEELESLIFRHSKELAG